MKCDVTYIVVCLFISIRDRIHLHLSKAICLPSLKTLLINIHSPQVASVNALLCGCPKIENLNLSLYDAAVEDIIFIPSTLKKLNFYADSNFGGGPSLEINAPHLEYLPITQSPFRDVSHKYNLHDVLEATLDLYPMFFGLNTALLNLLDALSRTKHLVLSATTTKVRFYFSYLMLTSSFVENLTFLLCIKLNWLGYVHCGKLVKKQQYFVILC
jgi:hypothetical protein